MNVKAFEKLNHRHLKKWILNKINIIFEPKKSDITIVDLSCKNLCESLV